MMRSLHVAAALALTAAACTSALSIRSNPVGSRTTNLSPSGLIVPRSQTSALSVRSYSFERNLSASGNSGGGGGYSSTRRLPITMPTQTPMVPYKPPGQDYAQFIDLPSRMYRDRIMFISQFIDDQAANSIISTLLYLRKQDPQEPMSLYFNVPGALLRPGLAVYDLLGQLGQDCEISTVNLGLCTGMGALLCGAGTKGKRCAMPNARFLLQRVGMENPFRGQASDIGLEVSNVKVWNDRLEGELARMTGQPISRVRRDMKRDFYLSSEEAVRYGLIDKVLLPAPQKRATQGKDVDLGTFEGEEEQKFQGKGKSGWGSGWKDADANARKNQKDEDDDEPKILKG